MNKHINKKYSEAYQRNDIPAMQLFLGLGADPFYAVDGVLLPIIKKKSSANMLILLDAIVSRTNQQTWTPKQKEDHDNLAEKLAENEWGKEMLQHWESKKQKTTLNQLLSVPATAAPPPARRRM